MRTWRSVSARPGFQGPRIWRRRSRRPIAPCMRRRRKIARGARLASHRMRTAKENSMSRLFTTGLLALAVAVSAAADDGMWMPQQIPAVAGELKQLGLQIDPNQLADLTGFPMGAIVSLGGCSASF